MGVTLPQPESCLNEQKCRGVCTGASLLKRAGRPCGTELAQAKLQPLKLSSAETPWAGPNSLYSWLRL